MNLKAEVARRLAEMRERERYVESLASLGIAADSAINLAGLKALHTQATGQGAAAAKASSSVSRHYGVPAPRKL
ncbi:hypothetical protein [Acidocella aromatica]|uniref:Uncharacterized protein n=1 Tax=Acidocella aromatica TaxID=1303579 RepID=A0A840VQE2_9PROT|nr:hypothetical protein [Acidocella aromatica]MBB5374329.1 hypothetical protein [Acidocella aromatica]